MFPEGVNKLWFSLALVNIAFGFIFLWIVFYDPNWLDAFICVLNFGIGICAVNRELREADQKNAVQD